jgi:hypothetical protein
VGPGKEGRMAESEIATAPHIDAGGQQLGGRD